MYIEEAAKESIRTGNPIIRKADKIGDERFFTHICPTNSSVGCIIYFSRDGENLESGPRWNPALEDIVADDWEVEEMER